MSSAPRVWVNGLLVAEGDPAVGALDHGVTVGDGAFEATKIVDGRVFALSRHHARLDRTLAGLALPPADHALLDEGIAAVLGAGAPIGFGRLRYVVTAGAGPLGTDRWDSPLTYIVTAAEQPHPPASVAVCTVPFVRNERGATVGLKTTSYAENVIALARARERGGAEAVFANTRGELCECTGSNIFVVLGGVIATPPLESGCLAGITRDLLIEWCREAGLPIEERTMPLEVLGQADEVFITSSTRDVLPVHDVDGRALAAPGPLTAAAAEVFARFAAEHQDP